MFTCNLLGAACFIFWLWLPSNKVKSVLEFNDQCLILLRTRRNWTRRGCSRQPHHRLPPQHIPPPLLAYLILHFSNCPPHLIQTWEPCHLLVVLAALICWCSRKAAGQQALFLLVKSKRTFQSHVKGQGCCILYHHLWGEADTISSLNHVFPLRSHASWLSLPLDFSLDSQLHGSKVKSLLTTKV